MKYVQQGFTLIELMIIVAIVGVLASIALSTYQDNTRRARASEGLSLANGVRVAVNEYVAAQNQWPAQNSDAGLPAPSSFASASVSSIEVEGNRITVTYNNKVHEGATLVLSGSTSAGGVQWSCSGGSLVAQLRPSSCRS